MADDFDLELLASDEYTKHFTGADLEGLCREAGMAAIRESRDTQRVVSWCWILFLDMERIAC